MAFAHKRLTQHGRVFGNAAREEARHQAGTKLLAINAPKDYRALLAPLPDDVSVVTKPAKSGCEIVHLFVTSAAEYERDLLKARAAMTIDGAIWVSWYKKSAKIPTDVT